MYQRIQKNIGKLTLLALLLFVAVMPLLTVRPVAAAAKTAKWNKDGTISFNGKTWVREGADSLTEGGTLIWFVPKGGSPGDSDSCVMNSLRFAQGQDLAKAKSASWVKNQWADAVGCVPTSKPVTVKFTNKYPGGSDTGQDGLAGLTTPSDSDTPAKQQYDACDSGSKTFTADPAVCSPQCKSADNCNLVQKYVNPIINKFLAPLAILAVVIGVIWGGIQYTTSAGDPQKTAAAKGKIQNALLGLVAFILLYAFLNWLIPGGLV